ncbi:SAM-dependent methyltransferase [Amycolatopsis sp. GM8]|uniref:SAM-dependent methyltransferase n=1 Tax=Amycolatopsis sp. GM8 TaxID=2896530 RepID=UPI001F270A9C|nr:SAM-dependent methyltransferase [Amycolatopsis sp. GM8]
MTDTARTYPTAVPVGVDPNRASIARVYDAFLNGKDNYEIDREVLRGVQKAAPEAQELATENRGFLIRACRFLSLQTDITQYLDLGSGLPTAENTHQVVQRLKPEAKVVYVDNDPVVLAHGRALLEENENTHFVAEDIFQPDEVLGNQLVRETLDFSKPIVLLQAGTLHHYEGEPDAPKQIMEQYIEALAPGSYVVVSHFLDPENEHSVVARKMEEAFRHSMMGSGTFRTLPEIQALFGDLEMVPPGVSKCVDWWPDGPQIKPLNQVQHCIAGGIGRKV